MLVKYRAHLHSLSLFTGLHVGGAYSHTYDYICGGQRSLLMSFLRHVLSLNLRLLDSKLALWSLGNLHISPVLKLQTHVLLGS